LQSASEPLIPDDVSIRVEDVWIRYRTAFEANPTLRGAFMRAGRKEGRKRQIRVVEAVKHVSFDGFSREATCSLTGVSDAIGGSSGRGRVAPPPSGPASTREFAPRR